jgi:adenosine deaminase
MPPSVSLDFLRAIPKTDLHVHLDGSLRLSTLLELAREAGVSLPSGTEAGLRETVFKDQYADLPDYLRGFAYTTAVMQTAEHVERIAYELAEDNLAEGVRYVEVRFAPQLHIHPGFKAKEVVAAACRGLERAASAHNRSAAVQSGEDIPFHYGLILCALRYFTPAMSWYYRSLRELMAYAAEDAMFAMASLETARLADTMAHQEGLPVVAFDLAGAEAGYPAETHRRAFQFAHERFVLKTVHAGEAYGPESIFQAITDCHANRVGHGTHLFDAARIQDPRIADREAYVRNLAEYIAGRRITLEVCLTSNLQTLPEIVSIAGHPLRLMLAHDLSVSICTDNRLVSNTSVTRELQLAARELSLTSKQLRNIVVAGFKGSFFPDSYNRKRAYVRKVLDRYQALELAHGITASGPD